ncbi:MAG: hypothetical protein OJF48_004499 [Afipia sp.]|nr:MAG: hypothetical protein OJF48_004499 [Afipia sp.]
MIRPTVIASSSAATFLHRRHQVGRVLFVERRRMAREIIRDRLRRPGRQRVAVLVVSGVCLWIT